uniref:Interleukin n=1 Tax=Naja naja TaxID=35670 RepID=A0A8C6YBU3_NAJNA
CQLQHRIRKLPITPTSCSFPLQGNSSNIGPLYTPEDITVCYANNLDCFYLELQVIQEEQEEHSDTLSRLIWRMAQLTRQLQKTGKISHCATYPPCHNHPEKPAMAFLRRLLEMFQWRCSAKDFRPSPGPGNSTLTHQATSSSPTTTAKGHQV